MAVQLHACHAVPYRLSVGLITAVHESGDKSDISNHTAITADSVTAKLFEMILEQRIASWAEEHAIKAKRQPGFRKDFRMQYQTLL